MPDNHGHDVARLIETPDETHDAVSNSEHENRLGVDHNDGRLATLVCLSICCGMVGAVLSLNECPFPANYSPVGGVEKQCTTIGYWMFGTPGCMVGVLTSIWSNHVVHLVWPLSAYTHRGFFFVAILAVVLTFITWVLAFLVYGSLLFMDGPHFDFLFENK